MMRSLINSDIEQYENQRQIARFVIKVAIPLGVPAALGSMFPPIAFIWFMLGTVATIFVGPGFPAVVAFTMTLIVSYLLLSFLVWLGMRWADRKYYLPKG